MTPAELLAEVSAAGLRVDLTDDGSLYVRPRKRITAEIIEPLRHAKPELVAHLRRREELTGRAVELLRENPQQQRAAQLEPDEPGHYLVAVVVRMADGGIAAGILIVPTDDGIALLVALDRACSAPLQ